MLKGIAKALGLDIGSILGRSLDSVDNYFDNETQRQNTRARAIETLVVEDTRARIARYDVAIFWYVWALFAAPLGFWWALVMFDTAFTFVSWGIPDLPDAVKPWADTIFQSLFGSGAVMGAAQAISTAIRGRG